MAYVLADRVFETSTSTGTGSFNLAGSTTGFRTFVAGVGTGNTCNYEINNGTDWEIGIGTITAGSPDVLARDTVTASSNAGAKVNWGSGTKNVFLPLIASNTGIVTAFTKTLLDDADATAARATLGLGTAATTASTAYATAAQGAKADTAIQSSYFSTPPILRVQCTKSSGTNGGQRAAIGSWQDSNLASEVLLNTVVTNNIAGASVASGVITLPAGTYKVRGFKTFYNTAASRVRFFNITDSVGLVVGSSTYASTSAGTGDSRLDDTFFTIAGTKTIKMQTWVSGTSSALFDLGVAVATGDTEIYGDFTFEKVA